MKTKNVTTQTIPSFLNKKMKDVLFNGEIMTHITDQSKSIGMWAKVTEMRINGLNFYGMWEKEMLYGDWKLLHFGRQPEVEPIWNIYVNNLLDQEKIWRNKVA
ncbi:MAG: hypothetical protein WCI31_11905 [Prolixibacteraceae bacterium]